MRGFLIVCNLPISRSSTEIIKTKNWKWDTSTANRRHTRPFVWHIGCREKALGQAQHLSSATPLSPPPTPIIWCHSWICMFLLCWNQPTPLLNSLPLNYNNTSPPYIEILTYWTNYHPLLMECLAKFTIACTEVDSCTSHFLRLDT